MITNQQIHDLLGGRNHPSTDKVRIYGPDGHFSYGKVTFKEVDCDTGVTLEIEITDSRGPGALTAGDRYAVLLDAVLVDVTIIGHLVEYGTDTFGRPELRIQASWADGEIHRTAARLLGADQ